MIIATPDRFKRLVHYVCTLTADDPAKMGAVQLNKALWLSDLTAYYRLGKAITAARYVRREFGPVPSSILPVLRDLQQEGALTVRDADHFGWKKKEYIVHREETGEFLTPEEMKIVKEIVEFVTEKHTGSSISEATHDHIWKTARDGEEIPHYTVFAEPGQITDEELEWAHLMLESER